MEYKLSEEWDFYACKVDGLDASVFVDLGIASEAPVESLPVLGHVCIKMNNPREDGLSSNDEYQRLIDLEDELVPAILECCVGIFVGRSTSGGNRSYYFYVEDEVLFGSVIYKMKNEILDYDIEYSTKVDEAWSVYFDFLHPSKEEYQIIMNRRVCDNLLKNGDDLTIPRSIDHFAYFSNKELAEAVRMKVHDEGFEAKPISLSDGRYCLEFSREDAPVEIDDIVLPLKVLCGKFNGDYDGWGCLVQKSPMSLWQKLGSVFSGRN